METDIRIRAFRAPEDIETCKKFIIGHRRVLEIYGISNITTNTEDWMFSPATFVIVVETLDGEKLYGGTRVQAADGKTLLPIETATSKMDPKIHDVVNFYAQNGTAELSGLWNSKEVAGYGIGSFFPIRAALVVLEQLGLESIFFLCSPLTVRFNKWVGSRIITEVGNAGTFYYPKLDLLATAAVLEKAIELPDAQPRERARIHMMRQNLVMVNHEKSPFKNIDINVHYDLRIASANPTEFKIKKQ